MKKKFGLPGDMQGLMKQAQKMQEELQRVQVEAVKFTAEGSSGGGMVRVIANGENQIASISIAKEVVDPDDIEMLEDLIRAAANEALQKVQTNLREKMGKVTGGMGIPGL